jgi:hypothetical protein
MVALYEGPNTAMIISRSVFLRMRNILDTSCTEIQNTYCLFGKRFRKNRVVSAVMWKTGAAGQATDDNIIRRMRFAFWITKATDTHSEYVILIIFLRQQL